MRKRIKKNRKLVFSHSTNGNGELAISNRKFLKRVLVSEKEPNPIYNIFK